MDKRGYELQQFQVSGVNCVTIGKKSSRVFITGGEDRKMNLWSIGKPTPLLSLAGHTSSVGSVAFDSAEVLVLGGSSNGMIKLWDLEEAKTVRSLSGHRSDCTAVEFHPFGEFFASGSLDADLKIWDIRKKGCIYTYKGHKGGIRTIRFTPDGRWVVTGGADNMVKLWDLTAGKLLHDFKSHNDLVQCIDFHPNEFLLATGSADQTVKFWDLETFELIGSAGPEATGVCSIIFHPDGKTLFCGLDSALKVFSWEPIRCHDAVEMGWSTLGDLGIYEGKLLGCSLSESRVGVWVADISLISPYALGVVPGPCGPVEQNFCEGISVDPSESIKKSITPVMEDHDSGSKNKDVISVTDIMPNDCKETVLDVVTSTENKSIATPVLSSGVGKNKLAARASNTLQRLDVKISSKALRIDATTCSVVKSIQSTSTKGTEQVVKSVQSTSTKGTEQVVKSVQSTSTKGTEQIIFSRNSRFSLTTTRSHSLLTSKKGSTKEIPVATDMQTSNASVAMPIVVPRDSLVKKVADSSGVRPGTAPHGKIHEKKTHQRKPSLNACFSESKLLDSATESLRSIRNITLNGEPMASRLVMSCDASDIDDEACTTSRNISEKLENISIDQPFQKRSDNDGAQQSSSETKSIKDDNGAAARAGRIRSLVERWEKRETCNSSDLTTKGDESMCEQDLIAPDTNMLPEALMENRDPFVNALKSRLTKLQVVRHFWEQDGIRGAINAVAKLPDHSVQVDIANILKDRVNQFNLDLFLSLLPLLASTLSSKTERHIIVSLELLLELVKIFNPVIRSTLSASSPVGVDLQAEQRMQRCKQCFEHLENIKQLLRPLLRRGGLISKHAGELHMNLQDL